MDEETRQRESNFLKVSAWAAKVVFRLQHYSPETWGWAITSHYGRSCFSSLQHQICDCYWLVVSPSVFYLVDYYYFFNQQFFTVIKFWGKSWEGRLGYFINCKAKSWMDFFITLWLEKKIMLANDSVLGNDVRNLFLISILKYYHLLFLK